MQMNTDEFLEKNSPGLYQYKCWHNGEEYGLGTSTILRIARPYTHPNDDEHLCIHEYSMQYQLIHCHPVSSNWKL